jgi:hypothetical protein
MHKHLGRVIKSHRHRGIKIKCKIVKLFQMNDVMARTHTYTGFAQCGNIFNSTLSHTRSPRAHNQQLHALSAFVYPSLTLYLSLSSSSSITSAFRRSAPLVLIVCDLTFYKPQFSVTSSSSSRVLFVICIYEIITLSLNQSIFIAMWAEGDVLMALIRINSSYTICTSKIQADSIQINSAGSPLILSW